MKTKGKTPPKSVRRTGIAIKLLGTLFPAIVMAVSLIVGILYVSTSRIISEKSSALLESSTENVLYQVEAWMNETLTALEQERDALQYFAPEDEELAAYVRHTAGQYDAFPAGMYLATTGGDLIHASFIPDDDFSFFEKAWYTDGLESEDILLGEVYFDADSQAYVVGASGVWRDASGSAKGVVAADVYLSDITSLVEGVTLQQTGGIFLVDNTSGMIMGHKDAELVGQLLTETDSGMYSWVADKISSGDYGTQACEDESSGVISLHLMEVPGTTWSLVSYVPQEEVMAELNSIARISAAIGIFSILALFVIVSILILRIIVKPVKQIDAVARQIADGKLDAKIGYKSRDELGQLTMNFNQTVTKLRDYVGYIDEISKVLDEIAKGNLRFELTYDYQGDFLKIKNSMENISAHLSGTVRQMENASVEVAGGSSQVSESSADLAKGSARQSGAIEELASSINDIAGHIKETADTAKEASIESEKTESEILESNHKMSEMMGAMEEISSKSDEIGKIIKTIESIAFQTNILALNAAVEAARAGEAGKGFAVVADEVRNLASKSADAAKNTTQLIEDTVAAVGNGTTIAAATAEAMTGVVESSKKVTELINHIASSSSQQAEAVSEITDEIDQISQIVQSNAAAAEESSAISEKLSMQANTLEKLVALFKI